MSEYASAVGRLPSEEEGVMWARERRRDKCDIAPREVGGMGSPVVGERRLLLSLQL